MSAHVETVRVAGELVAGGDFAAGLRALRWCVAKLAKRSGDVQPAVRERHTVRSGIGEPDVRGVSTGVNQELVLQLRSLSAEDHVDARPEVAVTQLRIGVEVGPPGRGGDVVETSRCLTLRNDLRVRVRASETQLERDGALAWCMSRMALPGMK